MAPKKVEINKIVNMYEHIPKSFLNAKSPNPNFNLHNFTIPFRAVCVAPTGSGKSNFISNLITLFCKGKGTFPDIFIICKDDSEELYRWLASISPSIQVKEGLHHLPDLDKFNKEDAHLVIIDDCQLEKNQKPVEEYAIRCRKKNVSLLYLAQNYFVIPKVIRNNSNYFVILKVSAQRELVLILKEQGLGLTKEQLLKMYDYATKEKFSPLIVDCESTDKQHKFRKGYTEYLDPDDFV